MALKLLLRLNKFRSNNKSIRPVKRTRFQISRISSRGRSVVLIKEKLIWLASICSINWRVPWIDYKPQTGPTSNQWVLNYVAGFRQTERKMSMFEVDSHQQQLVWYSIGMIGLIGTHATILMCLDEEYKLWKKYEVIIEQYPWLNSSAIVMHVGLLLRRI